MSYDFYDTNIMIYLLDQFASDRVKLLEFLSGKRILLSNMVLAELRNSKSRNEELRELSSVSSLFIISADKLADEECIKWREENPISWFSPARCEGWLISFLKDGLEDYVPRAASEIKDVLFANYGGKVARSIGDMAEEKRLRASLNVKIWQRGQNCGVDIPIEYVCYSKFPSQFVFDYVWWLRYSRQHNGTHQPRVTPNDLYDLLNSALAPYVKVWAGERSIISTLRQVKGRIPPTGKTAFKYLLNNTRLNHKFLRQKIEVANELPLEVPMLSETSLFNTGEFKSQYENWSG